MLSITDLKTRPGFPNSGLNVRHTKRGAIVIELDWWADPNRDRAWEAKMRAMFGDSEFEREYGRNWTVAAGKAFYPEWKLRTPERILALPKLFAGPVYRGWDFGYRRPACVWFQYSPRSRRAWILRELMPDDLDVWAFRDLVLYASGQRPIEYLAKEPRGLEWANKINEDPDYPNLPWFTSEPSHPLRFVDYSGPEANYHTAIVKKDQPERSSAEVLASAGIHLGIWGMEVKDRVSVVRKMLHFREDGYPAMLVDPACPITIKLFGGGLAFKQKSAQNPLPNEPNKDGFYEHIHDALGYGLCNVVELVDEEEVQRPDPIAVQEGRSFSMQRPDEALYNSIALKEMRGSWGDGF